MQQLSSGHARERDEAADLDVVGRDLVLAAVQPLGAVDRQQVRADALDVGAHRHEHPREVLHVGLAGRVADHGRAGRECGGHQRVLGRHHRGLVHEHVGGTQPARGAQHDLAVAVGGGAHRPERVQVRVQATAADHIAARRRHHGPPEPRQQWTGQQERRPDLLGQLGLDLDLRDARTLVHARGAERDLVGPAPVDAHADRAEDREHRVDIPDPRNVAHDHLVLGQDRRGEDRQRAVLVPGRDHCAGQRSAAFDYELLHGLSARSPAQHRAGRGASGKRNSHHRQCSLAELIALPGGSRSDRWADVHATSIAAHLDKFGSGMGDYRIIIKYVRMFASIRPASHLSYEHMFPRTTQHPLTRRARIALSLARSFLLLEDDYAVDWEVGQDEPTGPAHAHRVPLRSRRPARRPGAPVPTRQSA